MTDDHRDSGGTCMSRDEMLEAFASSEVVEYVIECDKAEKKICQWAYWLYKKLCGAVIHMTYSKMFNEWSLCVFYWRISFSSCGNCGVNPPTMMSLKRNSRHYFSGFCSRERGRHLNIKRRVDRY